MNSQLFPLPNNIGMGREVKTLLLKSLKTSRGPSQPQPSGGTQPQAARASRRQAGRNVSAVDIQQRNLLLLSPAAGRAARCGRAKARGSEED